jgi:hypothetical protein
LLLLSAVEDNPAMQTDPLKTDPPKRRRRWFQFRLRTLLIGVTLLAMPCAYVGWLEKVIADRKAVREKTEAMGAVFTDRPGKDLIYLHGEPPMPFPRNWLGDRRASGIYIPPSFREEDVELVRRVFPEAWVSTDQSDWNPAWIRENSQPATKP